LEVEEEMLNSPAQLHIPDGFLSTSVSIVLWVLTVLAIAVSLRRVGADLGERQVPLMGVLAACIFAGQMLNFPVAGGTSGHLVGAALAAILLGPWAGILVLTCVVGIQALIFQDGGLLAMGSNIFNMGVVSVFSAWGVYRLVQMFSRGARWGLFVGGFAAAWISVQVASLATALQLAASGASPANIAVPAMAGVHALIGIGEGLITVGALTFLAATRRDLVSHEKTAAAAGRGIWAVGLVLAIALAIVSPLASSDPDGLERVAENIGFLDRAQDAPYQLIPDYVVPGVQNEALATILAGVIGLLIVFAVSYGIARLRRRATA
jgi:cobalt/nickel transport system permease protein